MAPEDVAHAVWVEIEKLRDDIPPPVASTGLYADSRAADAFQGTYMSTLSSLEHYSIIVQRSLFLVDPWGPSPETRWHSDAF